MLPAIDPLSFPDAAFVGDVLVVDVRGRHLGDVEGVQIKPARGVRAMLGDPLGRRNKPVESGPDRLTLTVAIDFDAYPGDRRLWVQSPAGDSNQLLLTVML
ncbi:hypothetical protein [Gloeobacter kilaueensis]|uniref:PRC-barrel domain-containing protein n=1 Tax=Gloeobacter kilaueensis (strain ATCC BAA-2537 / CCAP 1431/1 / ULC 316 / JS1) TaxID=1183438 RepID=U5QLX7_GLOK1|nr:hypothetical protein [Gloeobacter kilaueensis]AGY59987.1 hypothetical protein GKIL_3741 [Gloeobacter kilaueensis JS1]